MANESTGLPVGAADRALDLLLALADAGPAGTTLGELASSVGINKATAYRALTTLRLKGFATQDRGGAAYRLGPAAFDLGERQYSPTNLARSLHPALVALSRSTEELVNLGVLAGDQVQYVDKVEPERAIRVWSAVGQRVPVASTSMGRALLAARRVPDEMLHGYLRSVPESRPVSHERLQEAVSLARSRGYAVEMGENEPDVACLGTAVMRGRAPVAAISITAPVMRMTENRQRELAGLIVREAGPLLPDGLSLMPALTTWRP
ncbi:Transcriptional regulator KdgR [Propionicimonas sp. T2.31MG-18]|uniref:IclR family transcriptional regulator n=1 Tax=Propionicimonas sp. T2.31MG-18 TaxID=3157620 RepID=UPI0035E4D2D4